MDPYGDTPTLIGRQQRHAPDLLETPQLQRRSLVRCKSPNLSAQNQAREMGSHLLTDYEAVLIVFFGNVRASASVIACCRA